MVDAAYADIVSGDGRLATIVNEANNLSNEHLLLDAIQVSQDRVLQEYGPHPNYLRTIKHLIFVKRSSLFRALGGGVAKQSQ